MAWGDVWWLDCLHSRCSCPLRPTSLALQPQSPGPPRDPPVPAFPVSAQACPRTSLHLDVSLVLEKKIRFYLSRFGSVLACGNVLFPNLQAETFLTQRGMTWRPRCTAWCLCEEGCGSSAWAAAGGSRPGLRGSVCTHTGSACRREAHTGSARGTFLGLWLGAHWF